MSTLIVEDLVESVELDAAAMTHVRGGLDANIQNPQLANQGTSSFLGGLGGFGVVAVNAPINLPTTVLTEVNPKININLGLNNLIGASQNQIQS